MLLIRDIMYCKPGKVRPMVTKMLALAKLSEGKGGVGKMRIMTDVSAERFWTVVIEIEALSFDAFMKMDMSDEDAKKMNEIMKDYHDLVDHGRREVYNLEG